MAGEFFGRAMVFDVGRGDDWRGEFISQISTETPMVTFFTRF